MKVTKLNNNFNYYGILSITLFILLLYSTYSFAEKQPNIILITADTLRPDRLGCYGYPYHTSPNIDELSKEAVIFTQAVTPVPLTTPSHASIFSGLYPRHHKVVRNGGSLQIKDKILSEILKENGYITGAFVSVVLLDDKTKLNRGFDTYKSVTRISYHVIPMKRKRKRVKKKGIQDHNNEDKEKRTDEKDGFSSKKGPESRGNGEVDLLSGGYLLPCLFEDDKKGTDLPDEGFHDEDFNYYFERQSEKDKKVLSGDNKSEELRRRKKLIWSIEQSKMLQQKGEKTITKAINWLKKQNGEKPFFLWVHLYDPHWPYVPPKEHVRIPELGTDEWRKLNSVVHKLGRHRKGSKEKDVYNIEKLNPEDKYKIDSLYDGEITYVDEQLNRLFSYLREKDIYDESIIIFMADHGETLGDKQNYYGHHHYIYEPSIRIPLLMKMPGILPNKINNLVRSIDVMPTLLSYLGIKDEGKRDGIGLMSLITTGKPDEEIFSYIETKTRQIKADKEIGEEEISEKDITSNGQIGIRLDKWKYFAINPSGQDAQKEFLFNISIDPGEERNLFKENPRKVQELKKLLKPYKETLVVVEKEQGKEPLKHGKSKQKSKKEKEDDQKRLKQLRSLGYL